MPERLSIAPWILIASFSSASAQVKNDIQGFYIGMPKVEVVDKLQHALGPGCQIQDPGKIMDSAGDAVRNPADGTLKIVTICPSSLAGYHDQTQIDLAAALPDQVVKHVLFTFTTGDTTQRVVATLSEAFGSTPSSEHPFVWTFENRNVLILSDWSPGHYGLELHGTAIEEANRVSQDQKQKSTSNTKF